MGPLETIETLEHRRFFLDIDVRLENISGKISLIIVDDSNVPFTRERRKILFNGRCSSTKRGVLRWRGIERACGTRESRVHPWGGARVKKIVSNLLSTGFPVSHLFCVPEGTLSLSLSLSLFPLAESR